MYSFKVLLEDGTNGSSKDKLSSSGSNSKKLSSTANGRTAAVNSASAMATSKQTASAHAFSAAAPGRSIDGKPVCYNCGSKGHTGDRCKQPYCDRCQQFRHAAGECSRACRKCGALDHRIDGGLPCKNYQCKECGLFGHIYAECPNIICNVCSEYGHLARDCPNKAKAASSSSSPGSATSSAAAAAPQAARTPQQQQQVPAAAPVVQQRQPQQTSIVTSPEEGQKRARVMDTLMSRLEEYALSLLLDEEKLALICRLSEDELRAILGRANAAPNLDAAAMRIQQQLDKQEQQQQQQNQQQQAAPAAGSNSSSSTAGAVTAAATPTAVFGSNSTTRVASMNGPTSAAGAATAAPSSSSSVAPPPPPAANGPYKSDAASRAHVCGRCGERGHNKDSCTTPKCSSCGRFRHTAGQCNKACRDCGGLDHKSGPGHPMCINYKCRECGLYGHVYAECPNIRCNMCGEIGHKALECPTIVCNICQQKGHKARDCTACSRCGQQGHRPKDCPGPQADVCCVHCGQWGHMASTCPGPNTGASSIAAEAAAAAPPPANDNTAAAVVPATAVSRPPPPPPASTGCAAAAVRPAVVAAGGAGAWAAAASGRRVVTPATVQLLPPAAAGDSAEALERQQDLLDLLMSRIEGYATTLVAAESELAALCRVADGDLRALLETANPEQQLDAVIKHVHAVQQQEAAATTAGTAAEATPPPPPPLPAAADDVKPKQQQPAQQQHRPGQGSWARPLQLQQSPPKQQRQQQVLSDAELSPGRSAAGGDTVKPAELLPQHAASLAAEFPGYFPSDWQQYASWRSLEERMAFPDPQNRSRAQYRQRRQYFQALTANAMMPAAARRGAAVQAPAAQLAAELPQTEPQPLQQQQQQQQEELEQEQQCTEQASVAGYETYAAATAAGYVRPSQPADDAAWQSADDTVKAPGEPLTADVPADSAAVEYDARPLPWVRLLPLDSVDEETLGMRFNNALDIMLPQFESFVQSLNEDKWRLLARIDESDLAELLAQPGAEQQLDLLLSSVLQDEGQPGEQQEAQAVSLDHQQDVPLQEYQQQRTAEAPAAFQAAEPHQQQQHADEPIMQPSHEQQQHYQQHGAASNGILGQLRLQQPSLQPYYQTAVATPGISLQQQYGFAQHSHNLSHTAPIPTTASGMGYSGLGIGMSVGLGIAGYRPDVPAAAAVYPGSNGATYQQGLHYPLQQQQQPLSQGAAFLQQLQQQHVGNGIVGSLPQMHHLALQQQGPGVAGASMQLAQPRHHQPGVAGHYGAAGAYYRRSSTGTGGGDDAREQDLERMIGFLGM